MDDADCIEVAEDMFHFVAFVNTVTKIRGLGLVEGAVTVLQYMDRTINSILNAGPGLTGLVKEHADCSLISVGFCLSSHVFETGFIPIGACVKFMIDKQAVN